MSMKGIVWNYVDDLCINGMGEGGRGYEGIVVYVRKEEFFLKEEGFWVLWEWGYGELIVWIFWWGYWVFEWRVSDVDGKVFWVY